MKRTLEDRRSHAKRLFMAGVPTKQIAKDSVTKIKTVMSWIHRGNWRQERDAVVAEKLPDLKQHDELRLESAYSLYISMVNARVEMVKQWVRNRTRRMDPDHILSYTGEYDLPTAYERKSFCDDILSINKVIEDSRSEINKLQSKAFASPTNSRKAKDATSQPKEHPHLKRVV
ncbi:MAG: hypothetical protein IPP57_04115 [Candidatus Obscuribacter sp.]|nr:hypothetical protein [Candidatus Obscuribacter sp.]